MKNLTNKMVRVTANPVLFLLLISFIYFVTLTIAQPDVFLYYICGNSGNYTSKSRYQTNLDALLSSLSSNTTYSFYNLSAGRDPDRVNTIALCRGDVEPSFCWSCVNDSIVRLRQLCPNQKEAIGWYDNCLLRYSNATILGNMDTSPRFYMSNVNNVTNVDQFNLVLRRLMDRLRGEAAGGGSDRKFATGNLTGPVFATIYGLMQCTPDLLEQQCYDCLERATNEIPICCGGKIGGRVFTLSCNLRYEIYRFYNDTPVIAPPPAPSLPPPPPPRLSSLPPTPPPGKNSNTTQIAIFIIIPTVSFVIIVASICIFLRMRKKRKRMEKFDMDEVSTVESLQYNFGIIRAATYDFSENNKLGQGGFGSVYKGMLQNGQEIAVKRLSRDSGQGEIEFKNEVLLVARLQHRNLVRLLGFSLEGTERLLIYEFMPNASLDHFIFNPAKHADLD